MSDALLQAWHKTVRRHGSRRAIVEAATGAEVTFAELDARAETWRTAENADRFGRRAVLFSAPNGIRWFEIFLGLVKAGAVVVPLDPGEPSTSQQKLARALRAAACWDGTQLQLVEGRAKRFREREIALIKLTSGSTGAPRPLAFTAEQLLADGRQVMRGMRFGARDLNYALVPCGHSYGLGNLTVPLIAAGVPLVCGAVPLPHAIAADFARWKPSVFASVPVIWRALAASAVELPGLRLAISAGAPLPAEVAKAFHERHRVLIHSFYGSSETGGISYDGSGHHTLDGGVGTALPGVKLSVQRDGRLKVASAAVFTHGNAQARGGRGAWVMGDLAELDARGRVRLLGRSGSIVKIGGRRLTLGEVAAQLRALPDVADAWVELGPGTEPVLVAVVATTLSADEVRARAAAVLPLWKIPKRLVTLPALPHSARGKLDTAKLRALVGA